MTDTVETIGKIHDKELPRDAIHVAVLSVVAQRPLSPGQRTDVNGTGDPEGPGIVDPFLPETVKKGQRFWMFMNPGSITSLNHRWTHPAVREDGQEASLKEQSKEWLRKFCKDNSLGFGDPDSAYADLINCHRLHGTSSMDLLDEEFRFHYRIVTGESDAYFTCSC